MLFLGEAVKAGRSSDFIAHEEAGGVGPIDRAQFDAWTAAVVKAAVSHVSRE
jgi:hypothetical protein